MRPDQDISVSVNRKSRRARIEPHRDQHPSVAGADHRPPVPVGR